MIPRHPLILKVTTVCATIALVCVMFYSSKSDVIVTRRLLYVSTLDPSHFTSLSEMDIILQELDKVPDPPTTTTAEPPNVIKKYVDGDAMTYIIDQEPCTKDHYLSIYVHSGPKHAERRRVIRNTWASKEILKQHKAKLVFVTGEVEDENLQATLENESELYKDIIQANFTDAYRNLTYKAIAGLRWVSENCPDVMYVLKTDDDIVVDIHRVVRLMHAYIEHKWGKKNILAGYIWPHMNVDRNKSSKWYTSPDEFPSDFFLKYCSGSAYLMSSDVVKKFYIKTPETPFFWVDDYYVTGLLARNSNVTQTSLSDRYILENESDMAGLLKNDTKTRFVFVHSPNTTTSQYVWQKFLDRW
ncbi:beta-1,3-galactosyltransferase 5-like [Mya arenaria]|uniref:beta-1,3-galactosyltransferase 5-like n=1 Tax=Mya arenaria TaxID=6604 RepID=UPI0022E11257|nr:beta-1,3-galactosyltransferase 5-like [Mya arenaria]XP_052796495.1 beta-1,3-galactosyltransferase 5-like [Mya arenaria]XP_052796496.1 beta-1,3-galactosyltransferase 5-like [Mya arenaria]